MRRFSVFVGGAILALLSGADGMKAAHADPIQMLPPEDFNFATCAGANVGVLQWDGSNPIRCVRNFIGDKDGNVSIGGNVGIGTAAPANVLDVYGAIATHADAGGNGFKAFGRNPDNYSWAPLAFTHDGTAYTGGVYFDSSEVAIAVGSGLNPVLRMQSNGLAKVASTLSVNDAFFVDDAGDIVVTGGGNSSWGLYWGQNPWTNPVQVLGWDQDSHYLGINGTYGSASDRRLKKNIEPLSFSALDTVGKLEPVTFEWKQSADKTNGKQYGFIAQEVAKILPDLVVTGKDKDQTLSLKYEEIIPILVKAIQEQQAEIEDLKKNAASKASGKE